jgi:hypothetical protein
MIRLAVYSQDVRLQNLFAPTRGRMRWIQIESIAVLFGGAHSRVVLEPEHDSGGHD